MFATVLVSTILSSPVLPLAEGQGYEICSVKVVSEVSGEAERQAVYQYDARADEWTFLTLNNAPPSEAALSSFKKADRPAWANRYGEAVKLFSNVDLELVGERDDVQIYRGGPLPEGSIDIDGRDISRHTAVELEIAEDADGAYVQRQRIYAPKPFRVAMIAKVSEAEFVFDFARSDDGRLLTVRSVTDAHFSALGKKQDMRAVATISEHDCPVSAD